MTLEIESHLFPIPETHYANSSFHARYAAISILSFHLAVITAKGNDDSKHKGHFFLRELHIPTPRPCTILAWHRLLSLGHMGTRTFYTPFLPSLREEDEVGQAIASRGVKVPSLSRRSQLHVRDAEGRIIWGPIFVGTLDRKHDSADMILTGKLERSNVVEALIVPRLEQHPESMQSSIRDRMEFLAGHGLLATHKAAARLQIPQVNRLLFQIVNPYTAADFVVAFNKAYWQVMADPACVESDYKYMMHEISEELAASDSGKSDQIAEVGKKYIKASRFGDTKFLFG